MNTIGQFRNTGFALLVALLAIDIAYADDSGYRFSVNGEPVRPVHYSLNAEDSVFAPGDVIYVGDKQFDYGGLFMTLGEEKDCRFVTPSVGAGGAKDNDSASQTSPRDGRIFLELPDGRRKVVAAIVTKWVGRTPARSSTPDGEDRLSFDETTVNPLDSMSPEEIHGLWGIYLNRWPRGIEQKLAYVNTERVCITITDFAGVGEKQSLAFSGPLFPPVPPAIRYLIVREAMSPGLRDFSRLGQFHDLLFLIFQSGGTREALDASLISRNTSLRYLDLSRCHIEDYSKLSSFTELRFLNIGGRRNIDDIKFVKDMRQLKTLFMDRTRVSSLSPLDGSESIREIEAGMTDVHVLPKGDLRSLKTINLVASKVSEKSVGQFRKEHPLCSVYYGWADTLCGAVQGATRLRVRSGGTCHRQIDREKTLAEIKEAGEIERFLKGIAVDEGRSGSYCMCCGDPTFEFYAGDNLLAMVGYHHGKSLRWAGGKWTGDAELTGPSQAFLVAWLAQNGVDGPSRMRQEQQKKQDEEKRISQRYAELIPKQTLMDVIEAQNTTKISWKDDPRGDKRRKLAAEAFKKHEKDPQTSVEFYLRIFGVRADKRWNVYELYDSMIAEHLLHRFKGSELAQGALRAMDNDEGIRGAGRWFFGEEGWRDLDEADCGKILPQLAKISLQHWDVSARKKTMVALSHLNSEWSAALLRDMLSRPPEPPKPGERAGSGWKINFGDGEAFWSGEYSDAAWAALCLAKLGDLRSLPDIEKLASESQGKDKELLQKALLLLREKQGKI